VKGYSRMGAALHGLRKYDEVRANNPVPGSKLTVWQAIAAYRKGLELDAANEQLLSGLQDAQDAQARHSSCCHAHG